MATLSISEGEIPFAAPGTDKLTNTWYKTIGDVTKSPPLILCHGGPGAGHECLLSLTDLYEQYGIPLIFYDQVGCGKSTHFKEKMGDELFWSIELYWAELDNLIDNFGLRQSGYHLLGQSWGGMLVGSYAAKRPVGLKKLIISSGPASGALYQESANLLLKELPEDVRKTLEDCESRGDHESDKYKAASMEFLKRHVCRLDPFPDDILKAFGHLEHDNTSYMTVQGPSEFQITGWLKHWDSSTDAYHIESPTLLINGKYDEMQDITIEPWFRRIPKVKWITLDNSSHLSHYEERDRYMKICGDFLKY
ncbi:proline-specific peptidase [Lindgomyces ingoldianus]|uniref:Proline-specific peptidase n=1 Tax=Lindgomyces ingoldianus TaxID=673940 RepID=A0ACB6QQF1_9PLEO|nr:proline-specific peptidase [Lindgomyces ingoldianus]KAF2469110.1 proline-specific peptidase [Lindgomyces ingoldianus]